MAVTLYNATAGTVSLPFPKLEQQLEVDLNQTLHLAPGGSRRCYTHGPIKVRIRRVFESLTEAEIEALTDWLAALGWQAALFEYRWTSQGASKKFTDCRLIGPPAVSRVSRNIYDVELLVEHGTTFPILNNAVAV